MSAEHPRRTGPITAAYSLALTLLVLGPLLGPGYLLLRDAVSTPRSYLTDSALGLGDAAPRAVPQDALLAVFSPVVDGGLLVKAILLAAIWSAGWGAAVLARTLLNASLGPQLVAVTVTIWNPYVAERLLQGHWSLLTGYAALPWIALVATRLRATWGGPATAPEPARSNRRTATPAGWLPWAALGGWLAVAGLTPTGSLLAGALALLLVGRRNLLPTAALWLASCAPWLAATALSGAGSAPSDPAGVAAFAARAEPLLGTLGSLAGLGGIWNATAVPDTRTTFFALIGTAILLTLVATGVRAVYAWPGGTTTARTGLRSTASNSEAAGKDSTGSTVADRPEEIAPPDPAESPTAANNTAAVRHTRRTLLFVAAAAILLPALGATGWGMAVGEFLVEHVPGAGLLRDTQKYVALAAPAFALCAAAGTQALSARISAARAQRVSAGAANSPASPTESGSTACSSVSPDGPPQAASSRAAVGRAASVEGGISARAGVDSEAAEPVVQGRTRPERGVTGWVAAGFVVLILASLPDMAWGVGGALRPVRYPMGWERVAAAVGGGGDIAVLPGGMFRKFRYSGKAPVLDPAPRMMPRDVLQTGELPVAGATVSGEGARAGEVERLLLAGGSPGRLAELGVGWVLVERGTPGPMGESKTTLAQLDSVYSDRDLELYRVPGAVADHDASTGARRVAGAAHFLWGALLLAGLTAAWGSVRFRRRVGSAAPQPV
ncbi:hypothetical protein ACWDOP_36405 [Nocardia sp. NPDC003693]